VLTAELVLTLPILLVAILGLFEFTWLFYARGLVVEASRVAARKATLPGANLDTVEAEVQRMLPAPFVAHARVQADLGEHAGDVVSVSVSVPMRSVAPDLLWPIGITLSGRDLYSETRMVRE
jgi:Flp pilus assembly protein TadG